jgi:MraZ protein
VQERRSKESSKKAQYTVLSQKPDSYNVRSFKDTFTNQGARLFLGKFSRTIDAKSRFTLPPAFQAELAGGGYMTQGFDRNLQILTGEAFRKVVRRASALNLADPLARQLLRLLLATAVPVQTESQSTVTVPENLKEFAALHSDVVLIGQGDYIEIWAPEMWEKQEAQLQDAEANASRFSALDVVTH